MADTALTQGAHHIGLTVPNLEKARGFFVDTLGFTEVGARPEYPAIFVSDGVVMITLWRAEEPETAVSFNRKNVVGLHHFALTVKDEDSLAALHTILQSTKDVVIEFAPEPLGDGPMRHMMCAIPGGIRVEFIAPAA